MCIRDSGITSETEAVEALIFLVVSSNGFNSLMQCDMMSFSKLKILLTLEYELAYEARSSLSNTSFHHMKCTIPASWNVFDNIKICLLYTSDAADERSSVDLGGRRIIKKKKHK